MAHEPKLEILTIELHPTSDKVVNTFAGFLESKFKPKGKVEYNKLFKLFFEDFIHTIDNKYHKDDKKKKAIGIKSKVRGEKRENLFSYASEKTIIEGRLKGGRYGQNRSIGDTANPESETEDLSDKKVVLDDFYFLLFTPLGSTKGILILQSYSDDNIKDIFIDFIGSLYLADGFYKPIFTPKCPNIILEEFKNNSVISVMKFKDNILITDIENKSNIDAREVTIEVKLTYKDKDVKIGTFDKARKVLEKIGIKRNSEDKIKTLDQFKSKTGTLINDKHMSSFELDSNFEIKPTIFLKGKIELQKDSTPVWESLKKYSHELLEEVIKEVFPEYGS